MFIMFDLPGLLSILFGLFSHPGVGVSLLISFFLTVLAIWLIPEGALQFVVPILIIGIGIGIGAILQLRFYDKKKTSLKKTLLAGAIVIAGIAVLAVIILPIRLARDLESDLYIDPQPVQIAGYEGIAMEPFISLDGRFLFFNNSNEPKVDTNLHFAERTGQLSFRYLGELPGDNSKERNAVPSMDAAGHFYFTTDREYARTLKSTYTGDFDGKRLANIRPAPGDIWPRHFGAVNMDVGVSPDGGTLYISRAVYLPPLPIPVRSDLLVARLKGGIWSIDPTSDEIMKTVNTRLLEYAPAISPDGLELYFTRASLPEDLRIMVATRPAADIPFGEPHALRALTGFVEAPTVSADMQELFFHKKVGAKFIIYRALRNSAGRSKN